MTVIHKGAVNAVEERNQFCGNFHLIKLDFGEQIEQILLIASGVIQRHHGYAITH